MQAGRFVRCLIRILPAALLRMLANQLIGDLGSAAKQRFSGPLVPLCQQGIALNQFRNPLGQHRFLRCEIPDVKFDPDCDGGTRTRRRHLRNTKRTAVCSLSVFPCEHKPRSVMNARALEIRNPVMTSSKHSTVPSAVHISRRPCRKPGSGAMKPPLPTTGSKMTPAICRRQEMGKKSLHPRLAGCGKPWHQPAWHNSSVLNTTFQWPALCAKYECCSL